MGRVTSQNRQSIAKSLRYIASCLPPIQSLEEFRSALEDELFTGPGHASYTEIFNRLADLIGPTRHDFGGEEGTNGESYDFACSACGWCGDVTKPNYCPNCGARVVNDVPDAEA